MSRDENETGAFAEICAFQSDNLQDFRKAHPDLDVVFNATLNAGTAAVGSLITVRLTTAIETYRWLFWQILFNYQQQSLLLIVGGNTDAGLALLRLATELARDIAFIGNDPKRLELWLNRRDRKNQREYRKLFRFDETDSFGAFARQAYDLCSELGVHGHLSDLAGGEWVGTFDHPQGAKFALRKISESGILRALQIWLGAFTPLHILCLETFLPKY